MPSEHAKVLVTQNELEISDSLVLGFRANGSRSFHSQQPQRDSYIKQR